uniref:Cap-specific mRNA (nucleoside-2'-O-)-methyltransferase 2 n=1 Tax=Panagrolaimus sp. PS1159 TaxID=55785 RepID=A0AC35F9M8_9BILA
MSDEDDARLFATYQKITDSLSNKEVVLKGQWEIGPPSEEINVNEVESILNNVRAKTGGFKHKKKWRAHTEWTHPLGKFSTMEYGKTRAYLKMSDILHRFPRLLIGKNPKLKTLHLCEAPGNFVAAIADVLDEKPFEWKMNSLNPHYEWNNPMLMLTEDAFILGNEDRMFFGENNSGNIFKLTKADFENLGKVDLVTADGSFDCTEHPEEQEKLVCSLIAREAFLAMNALEKGGSLVLKMFTFFYFETREILQRIIGSFEEIHLRKPAPSKPGNSEIYVIAFGFLGQMQKDESPETLLKIDTACLFFAQKQIEMIEFNLETISASQFLKCQIEEEKQKIVNEFIENVPVGKFWSLTASSKPFFPLPLVKVDIPRIHLSSSPFVSDVWLRQRKVLAVPYDSLPPNRQILNPCLAIFDESYIFSDFAELQNLKDFNNLYPNSNGSTVFIFTPWILTKKEIINKLMMILSDAEKLIIQTVPNTNCGILSRFSLSIMAILLDTFDLDGLPNPGSVILLKRRRYVSPIVMQLLEDVRRQLAISEVLCFIPINDLSDNFRMFIRYFNGYNYYFDNNL